MITEEHYVKAAELISCEPAVIKAVAAVESRGAGFLSTGEIKILFEPHIMWRMLNQKGIAANHYSLIPKYKQVVYKHQRTYPYGKNSEQWDKLRLAGEIDLEAAHLSASYGKFQVMGFNHKAAGYNNIFEMVSDYTKGEDRQLLSFVKLIMAWGLQGALINKQWTVFARAYNGPGYKNSPQTVTDDYDYKLREMYKKLTAKA